MEFIELYELSTRVAHYELLLKEEIPNKTLPMEPITKFQDLDLEMKVDIAKIIGKMHFFLLGIVQTQ